MNGFDVTEHGFDATGHGLDVTGHLARRPMAGLLRL
jgi:hypothetical protein